MYNLNSLYITYSQTTTYQPSRHYTLALHTTTRLLASCELLPPHATYATHPPTVNSHSHPLFSFLFPRLAIAKCSQVYPKCILSVTLSVELAPIDPNGLEKE